MENAKHMWSGKFNVGKVKRGVFVVVSFCVTMVTMKMMMEEKNQKRGDDEGVDNGEIFKNEGVERWEEDEREI